MVSPIVIDGSEGEGGGQILRTSLALAALTRQSLVLERIRAGRAKPGLGHQHLCAVRAAAAICGADLEGDALRSSRLSFAPGEVRGGAYRFVVPTAGSACLVLQTVLYPLLLALQPSQVTCEGGTHNPLAPPFEFLEQSLFPVLRRMGARIEARLERHGFMPAGGGRLVVQLEPCEKLTGMELIKAEPIRARQAHAIVARLPAHIAVRELKVVQSALGWDRDECRQTALADAGPGNVLLLQVERGSVTETISAFGQRGISAERVARRAVAGMRRYLAGEVPVGEHLADQLLLPCALAGEGAFATLPLSAHSRTNLEVIRRFIPLDVAVSEQDGGNALVRFGSGGGAGRGSATRSGVAGRDGGRGPGGVMTLR